jgi:hypothetical protein
LINNKVLTDFHKKGPIHLKNAQVFNKDGTKDRPSTSMVNAKGSQVDINSQKTDSAKSSLQILGVRGDAKDVEGGEQLDEKEKLQMPNNDLPKKRRGPLLPLPPTITKDDTSRYVKHLCQINTPLAQNPFLCFQI